MLQELKLHLLGQTVELRVIWKVQQYMAQPQVAQHNFQTVQVSYTLDKLSHDDSCLLLPDSTSLLKQAVEVEAVCVLLYHV